MSKLVGNPMDRFPCDTAHSIQSMIGYTVSYVFSKGGVAIRLAMSSPREVISLINRN